MSERNKSNRPALVFLLGPPRSGTTWLQKLLGNHPEIGTAQESHIFNHFLGKQLQSWDHLKEFNDGRGGIGLPAYQTEDEFIALLNSQVHEIFSNANEYHKGKIFLEKTPDHIRHMPDIQRVVPESKIILMTRKPVDVIESMLSANESWGKHWAPGSTVQAMRLFQYFARKGQKDIRDINPDNIHIIEYEKLRENPELRILEILDYLQLEHSPEIIQIMLAGELNLNKYGEFAKRTGNTVIEPEGFSRSKKGKLNWIQRAMIKLILGSEALDSRVLGTKV